MLLKLIGAARDLGEAALSGKLGSALTYPVHVARVVAPTGLVQPLRPDFTARTLLTIRRWGNTAAAGVIAGAAKYGDAPMIIDELGELTFGEVDRRTNAIARGLASAGIGAGSNVGVMCRNHRGFIESMLALSKLGANVLLLNTAFAGPQLVEVCGREGVESLIFDQEFAALLARAGKKAARFVAWREVGACDYPTLEDLVSRSSDEPLQPPKSQGRVVILTSGTTGTPKGAGRSAPKNLTPAVALLSKFPFRVRERALVAAPLFHSWGFSHFTMGLVLSWTFILQRRFDPEATLAAVQRYRPEVMPVVPVMAQRILDLPEPTRAGYDTSSLRVVGFSGSALPGELALRFMDAFGDVVYNLYGSTEVAYVTVATPADLRAAPGTAGRPPRGTTIKLFDPTGNEVAPGEVGRIFVANEFLFEGYTGGGSKAEIAGLMSTGDVGHFDADGRLFVEGRDDEMIVSGGENVFPREVEDLLAGHPAIREVAVIGIKDEDFGQRLKAVVALKDGARLTADGVRAYVKSNLARYKVPREVEFVDTLPRNATGKVLKRDLVKPGS